MTSKAMLIEQKEMTRRVQKILGSEYEAVNSRDWLNLNNLLTQRNKEIAQLKHILNIEQPSTYELPWD